jgi:hypothetical protein
MESRAIIRSPGGMGKKSKAEGGRMKDDSAELNALSFLSSFRLPPSSLLFKTMIGARLGFALQ